MKCTVTKPFEHNGRTIKPGTSIELHPAQAESLRLQGKIKFAPVGARRAAPASNNETKVNKTEKL